MTTTATVHVIYAYYEKNQDYKQNLLFFLQHGFVASIDYTFVVNGQSTVTWPKWPNMTLINRDNVGYDFQGYYHGLLSLQKRGLLRPKNYYLFINSTVRGPFIPPYTTRHIYWYTPYLDLMSGVYNTKLVGSTINGLIRPHVQSYVFMIDYEGVDHLLKTNFFKVYTQREDVILYQEIEMSQVFLRKGWNIDCLIPEYHGLDYRSKSLKINSGDIRYAKNLLGRELTPYEVIFIKSSWGQSTEQMTSLTRVCGRKTNTERFLCSRVRYGQSEKDSIDVTQQLIRLKTVSTFELRPNTLFGDPCPEHSKKLFMFLDSSTKIILQESENRIVDAKYYYTFEIDSHGHLNVIRNTF
jgi:hypothetical protein